MVGQDSKEKWTGQEEGARRVEEEEEKEEETLSLPVFILRDTPQ